MLTEPQKKIVESLIDENIKKFEAKLTEIKGQYESVIKTKQSEINELRNEIANMRNEGIRGHGVINAQGTGFGSIKPSREDLSPFAMAKLESVSLREVCEEIALAEGKTLREIRGEIR